MRCGCGWVRDLEMRFSRFDWRAAGRGVREVAGAGIGNLPYGEVEREDAMAAE